MTLADVETSTATLLIPLLSLGPAFAALFYSLRSTILIGVTALALCVADALIEDAISLREETLAIATVAGVTLAAVAAGAARERRERVLADVRTVAEVAQQVVLRPVPAHASPVRFAVRYLSAAARAKIGGDLYDVIPGAGGTWLIIGDVTGKGLAAVQAAAAVLGAFRAAASEEAELEAIAARIETSLGRQLADEEFVTAVLAHVSPDGAKVSLLNCGHPAPLLLPAGEPASFADPLSPGLPLGLGTLAGLPRNVTTLPLGPGDALLFYTDGISEARDRSGARFSLTECCRAVNCQDPGAALDLLQQKVLRHVGHPLDDDAAILLLSRPAGEQSRHPRAEALCSGPGNAAKTAEPPGRRVAMSPARGASRVRLLALAGVTLLVAVAAGAGAYLLARPQNPAAAGGPRPSGIPASISTSLANLMELSPLPHLAAPGFTLTDQAGRRLALSSLQGKAVVLEFMDPHCTDICPIVSQEFVDAYHQLGPAASKVVFVAVNVNQYHESVAAMAAFSRAHQLTTIPSWHFFTGPTPQLQAVWHAYHIDVSVPNPNADIVHTSAVYFIDPQGRERYVASPQVDHNSKGTAFLPVSQINDWGHGIALLARTLTR